MKFCDIDLDKDVFVIAEIGNNHEGDFHLAIEMMRQAANAGAHAVKFQTFQTEHYVSCVDKSRTDLLTSFELNHDQWRQLKEEAIRLRVIFCSTPFDLQSAAFLNDLVPFFKISSGDNTFLPLLSKVAEFSKPIILSCGMAKIDEIERAKKHIEGVWEENSFKSEIAFLHCVSSYPTFDADANLLTIPYLKKKLGGTIGYSDHTLGIEAACTAVSLGAQIIEKHFTIDKNLSDFQDHKIAATPNEFKDLVKRCKRIRKLLGNEGKMIAKSEEKTITAARRSIVAGRDLPKGHLVELKDLSWVRPPGGLPPGKENILLGRKLIRSVKKHGMITEIDI